MLFMDLQSSLLRVMGISIKSMGRGSSIDREIKS